MECQESREKPIEIALAGNPNVGKSVVFNQLTGMSQTIGNWPGKTVKRAEGYAAFGEHRFKVVDLPGIYNLSTYSLEEIITREYIIENEPDYIVNIIDANRFERNLYFTLQLLMLKRPVIICLNQYDLLKKRNYEIDAEKLSEILGVPVVKTVAVHNRGIHEILEEIIKQEENGDGHKATEFTFSKEIEKWIQEISDELDKPRYVAKVKSKRFAAIKLIEHDEHCMKRFFNLKKLNDPISEEDRRLYELAVNAQESLEELHGEQISTIVNSEFFKIADQIEKETLYLTKKEKRFRWGDLMDHITMHSFFGYIMLALILLGTYAGVFLFGDLVSGFVDALFEAWTPSAMETLGGNESWLFKVVWNGLFGSFMGGLGGVLPFVIPFFFIIEILQDIGYLPRAAYLMDNFMHKLGIHGKSIIPVLLGFGCNVPAMTAASIMETEKDKKRSMLISSMIPCSAVTTIVLGLVAANHGIFLALLLYVVNFVMIIFIGRILTKVESCDISELIIEIHDFRRPNLTVTLKQTWHRSKEFIVIALPLIVVLGALMEIMLELEIFTPINVVLSPVIVYYLGLPLGVGVFLFYGILRKELNLVLLELYVASPAIALTMTQYMSAIQMVVFALITMLYIPCMATLITVGKEAGSRFATHLGLFEVLLALIVGGMVNWLYQLIHFLGLPFLSSEYAQVIATFVLFFAIMAVLTVVIEKTEIIKRVKIPDVGGDAFCADPQSADRFGCNQCWKSGQCQRLPKKNQKNANETH